MARHLVRVLGLGATLAVFVLWSTYGQAVMPDKPAPEISGAPWLNSRPLTRNDLKGRVVLVEFWTYG
jgi:hypothetical protein